MGFRIGGLMQKSWESNVLTELSFPRILCDGVPQSNAKCVLRGRISAKCFEAESFAGSNLTRKTATSQKICEIHMNHDHVDENNSENIDFKQPNVSRTAPARAPPNCNIHTHILLFQLQPAELPSSGHIHHCPILHDHMGDACH